MIQFLKSSFVESVTTPPNSQMNRTLRKVFNKGAQPPSGTADPLLGGKVDHLRPAWTGPLLPLKFLTLATLMPGCPDKYKHLVRDSTMKTRSHKHKTEAKPKDGLIQNLFLGGGKSSDTRRGSF